MNDQMREFARETIRDGLSRLPEGCVRTFKLMYGRDLGRRPAGDSLAMSVADVIAEIPDDELDWAMQQIDNSLRKHVA